MTNRIDYNPQKLNDEIFVNFNNVDNFAPSTKSRYYAASYLYYIETKKIYFYSNIHLSGFLSVDVKSNALSKSNKNKMKKFVKIVLKNIKKIDLTLMANFDNWTINRIYKSDLAILRLSCAEVLFTNTSNKIIISEAIKLAGILGDHKSKQFINAVLDKISNTLQ